MAIINKGGRPRKPKALRTVVKSFSIPRGLAEALVRNARRGKRSSSAVVVDALTYWLDTERQWQ